MESFHFHRGFTLVELMVVLAIIGVIMSIVLTSQSTFNKTIILKSTAYDIALTLRSTQTFGLGSRVSGVSPNVGYGLHFQRGNSFLLFADINAPSASSCHGLPLSGDINAPDAQPGNCAYDSDSGEFKQIYTLNNGMTIKNFCVNGLCGYGTLDIVFSRPNPDAYISVDGSYFASYASACLDITSPQGGDKYVSISKSGQIIANAASCP